MPAPGVRVRLLGRFEVEGVDTATLRSRKARTLLRVLALERGRAVTVHRLIDIIWGDATPSEPADQLAVLVSRVRAVLGAEHLRRGDAGYALSVAWTDVDAAAEFLAEAERRLAAGASAAAQAAAHAALGLQRGPLLADEPEATWTTTERAAAERMLARTRRVLARAALADGDLAGAVAAAEAALDVDPCDEEALRLLMAAHASAGRKATALAGFERLRTRLADELGVDPSPATLAAQLAVLQDRAVPDIAVGVRDRGSTAINAAGAAMEHGFVGRDDESAALSAALDRVSRGRAELVAIEGEAGIGKTRLVDEWTSSVAERGVTILSGRSDELGRALPLQPVIDALAEHLARVGGAAAADLLGPDAGLLAPSLGAAAFAPSPATPTTGGDPAAARSVIAGAVLRVLTRIASDPTVLVIEDVHVADAATVELMNSIQRRPPAAHLLVIATRRVEEGTPIDATVALRLGPLAPAACALLVGDAAEALYERSGGNPLLLLELSRAHGDDEIPETLREVIVARCERLGPAARTVRAAAVLGPGLDLEVLAAVLELTPITLLDHLEEAARRHLLVERSGTFTFRHGLLREALVADTGAARQALLHREAARLISSRPRTDPAQIAYHARLGGDVALASRSLIDAARIASVRGEHEQALRLLDDAQSLDDTAAVHIERARVLLLASRPQEANDEGRTALALGGGAAALEILASARYHMRDLDGAVRLAAEATERADDDRVRAGALLVLARALHARGDLPAAEAALEDAARATEIGAAARGLWLGFLRIHQGHASEGMRLVDAAAASQDVAVNLFAPVHLHFVAGYGLAAMGRVDDAMRRFDELDLACERMHVTRFAGRSDNFRGWILRNLGEYDEADEHTSRAIEAGRRIAYAEVQAQGWLDLADSALQRRDTHAAASHIAQSEPFGEVEHAYRWRHRLRLRLLTARLALLQDDLARAEELLTILAADAAELGIERYVVQARLLLLQVHHARAGRIDTAKLAPEIEALTRVAGLDGWRLAAEVAAVIDSATVRDTATQLAAHVAAHAGPRRERFERHAAKVLSAAASPAS